MQSKRISKRIEKIFRGSNFNVRSWYTFPTSRSTHQSPQSSGDIRANMKAMHAWSERNHILMDISTRRSVLSELIRLSKRKWQHEFHTCIKWRVLSVNHHRKEGSTCWLSPRQYFWWIWQTLCPLRERRILVSWSGVGGEVKLAAAASAGANSSIKVSKNHSGRRNVASYYTCQRFGQGSHLCDFSIVVELKEENQFNGKADMAGMHVREHERTDNLISRHSKPSQRIIDRYSKNIKYSRRGIRRNRRI